MRTSALLAGAAIAAGACFDIPPPLELPAGDGGGATGGTGGGACAFVEDGQCKRVVQLAAGRYHTCAVVSDGRLYCWGGNDFGQLGDPNLTEVQVAQPHPVPGLPDVRDVAVGSQHTCALDGEGVVWCWGRNHVGQVGNGTVSDREPSPVAAMVTGVDELDARSQSTCAVVEGREVWCWGFALDGQAWQGGDGSPQPMPAEVPGLEGLDRIDTVANGGQFACAAGDGMTRVLCWGHNANGRLGDGSQLDSAVAVDLATSPSDEPLAELSAASDHACVLTGSRREVQCWGLWSWLNAQETTPTLLVSFAEAQVEQLIGGWRHGCMLMQDGAVRCYGRNDHQQLGMSDPNTSRLSPMIVPGMPPIAMLGARRHHHGCAVATDERVWCWGRNEGGQLGSGQSGLPMPPTEVTW